MATAGVSLLEKKREYVLAIERLQQLLGGTPRKGRGGSTKRSGVHPHSPHQGAHLTPLHPLISGGVYCGTRRGDWWIRLSINLEHLGRVGEALEMAEAGLADDWLSHGDRLALQRRVLRLGGCSDCDGRGVLGMPQGWEWESGKLGMRVQRRC